jgi:DNA-directed RNA polymerase specialized sigma24 family protein
MQDPRLRRVFDSMDVCQSVLASFFARAAAGRYDLDRPEQLTALLIQMARHKLGHQVSRQTARRRDIRRVDGNGFDGAHPAGGIDPVETCAGRELLDAVRLRLSEEERQLADRRGDGHDWATIAAELGGTPDGRRMQLGRALDRVAGQLGLDSAASI